MTDASSPAPPRLGRRPRRGVRLAAAAAGALGVLGTAGCGIQSTATRVVGAAPTLQAANDVTGSGSSTGANQYELFFFRDGRLSAVIEHTDATVTQELILSRLIQGPSQADRANGYSTLLTDVTVQSFTAHDQQWNYSYSATLDQAQRAQVVCSIETDLGTQSVGTATADGGQNWNSCGDFEDYGAPAVVPNLGSATASSPEGSGN